MQLPKELTEAYAAINQHIDDALNRLNQMEADRVILSALSKEQLIEEILRMKYTTAKGKRCINIEDLAYSILCDPKCSYLTYDMIEAAIASREIPGVRTKAGNLRWYASKGIEKERDVVPRATKSAISALLSKIA